MDLDTAAIDEALGRSGTIAGGVYKFFIARRDPVTMSGMLIPPSMGLATALNFQPTGNGRAAINGDFVMTAAEVQDVVQALRGGGIDIVAIHNHGFDEQPRLFYMHFWAENDAVALAHGGAEDEGESPSDGPLSGGAHAVLRPCAAGIRHREWFPAR